MTDEIKHTLVSLVGEQDSLFEPVRGQGGESVMARLQTRRYFHERGGLAYRQSGDAHQRARLLSEMEAAGLVSVVRNRGRATHWKPTDAGDQLARALAEQPGQRECLVLMAKLKACADVGNFVPAGGKTSSFTEDARFVPEQLLGGWDFEDKPAFLAAVQEQWECLAFCWPRKWVTSALYGPSGPLLLYALTPAGLAALAAPPPVPKLPKPDDSMYCLFIETFLHHAELWKTATRRNKNDLSFQGFFLTCETVNERKRLKLSAGTAPAGEPRTKPAGDHAGTKDRHRRQG